MARRRWLQKLTAARRRKELDRSRRDIAAGEAKANALHSGQVTYRPGDPRPRNAQGQLISALLPARKPSIPGARERRQAAWSLRAAGVARDKRTGRFKRRR